MGSGKEMKKAFHYASLVAVSFLLYSYLAMPLLGLQLSQGIPSYGTVVYQPSRLHTEGRWIKDGRDNIVRLKGASVFWRWQWAGKENNFDPLNYIDETPEKYDVCRDSGANFLRVQLNKWLWDNAFEYVRAVDTLIEWCKNRNIMIVLTFASWHDCLEWREWTDVEKIEYIVNGSMRDFMSALADRYKDDETVIGFEIMPERARPTFWASYRNVTVEESRSEYRQGMISAITAIHAIDPTYLVFIYPTNDYKLLEFIQEDPIDEPNVVYSIMTSVSWDKGWWEYADAYYEGRPEEGYVLMEQTYKSWLFDVLDLGYPAMVLETEVKNDLPNATRYVDDLLSLLEKHDTGVCWWTYDRQRPTWEWLFLLEGTEEPKPALSEIGLVWALHMKLV